MEEEYVVWKNALALPGVKFSELEEAIGFVEEMNLTEKDFVMVNAFDGTRTWGPFYTRFGTEKGYQEN